MQGSSTNVDRSIGSRLSSPDVFGFHAIRSLRMGGGEGDQGDVGLDETARQQRTVGVQEEEEERTGRGRAADQGEGQGAGQPLSER